MLSGAAHMKQLFLVIIFLSTPAHATNYVINLDTGMYGAITASVLLDQQPPLDLQTPTYTNVPVTVTPLPPTIWLFATGLAALAVLRRKSKN
jgi:hypothetical protein